MSETKSIEELLRFDPITGDDGGDDEPGQKAEDAGDEQKPDVKAEADDSGKKADGSGEAGSESAEDGKDDKSEDAAAAADDTSPDPKQGKPHEPAEEDDRVATLEEMLRQQSSTIQSLQERLDAAAKPKEEKADDPIPDYAFTIPNEIVEGVVDDDPKNRQAALAFLVRGIGQEVHAKVREEMQTRISAIEKASTARAGEQSQQSAVESIKTDYFGKYPDHDNDLIRPLVQRKATEVMKEWGASQWSAKVRDEIGKRVKTELEKAGLGGKPATPSNGAAVAPHMRRSSASPTPTKGGANTTQDIRETLFG